MPYYSYDFTSFLLANIIYMFLSTVSTIGPICANVKHAFLVSTFLISASFFMCLSILHQLFLLQLFQNSHVHTQTIKACVATNKHLFSSNTINDFKWVLVTRKKSCICRRKWHFKRYTHSLFNLRNRVCISLASPLRSVFRLLSFKSLFLKPPLRLHEQINTRLYPERCSVTIIWKNRKH